MESLSCVVGLWGRISIGNMHLVQDVGQREVVVRTYEVQHTSCRGQKCKKICHAEIAGLYRGEIFTSLSHSHAETLQMKMHLQNDIPSVIL